MFAASKTAGVVATAANYIEDVFSTYLLTGNASTQTITNGIDLVNKGGLVWSKNRSTGGGTDHCLNDSARNSFQNRLVSNSTTAQDVNFSSVEGVDSVSSTGFVFKSFYTGTYVTWTFRKQPKFFDVQTFTSNSSNGGTFTHNLGAVPGCLIVKSTAATDAWLVWHRGLTGGLTTNLVLLNTTGAQFNSGVSLTATDTSITIPNGILANANSGYVAYLFAHNAGGFGLTGTDNVISCGSFTSSSIGLATVDLGYEPQWILYKGSNGVTNWQMVDNMRGFVVGAANAGTSYLNANTSGAEATTPPVGITNTGFNFDGAANITYIYIAIRRGPMKVPTSGTSVFIPVSATPSGATTVTTNFPVDLAINAQRDAGTSGNKVFWDRLRGSSTAAGQGLFSNLTNAEVSYSGNGIGLQSNTTIVDNYWNTLNGATTPVIYWNMRRAPSFFDEVCYTGTGSNRTVTHNLGVAPELMIIKRRSGIANWTVYQTSMGTDYAAILNSDIPKSGPDSNWWNNTAPTSSVFSVGTYLNNNDSGSTYVAYLFASCPGVSRVGSYTGTGATQTIDCGFTGGARFVLIKRTDSTGDWYVYDTARGMTVLTDPYLLLNSTAAESATLGSVTTVSTGFAVNASILAAINTNGASYIFLAIA